MMNSDNHRSNSFNTDSCYTSMLYDSTHGLNNTSFMNNDAANNITTHENDNLDVVGVYSMQTLRYGKMMKYKKQLIKQKRQYCTKLLEQHYPVKYVIAHCLIIIALSASIAILETMIINEKSGNYEIISAIGLAIALYFLIASLLTLIIGQYYKIKVFLIFFNSNSLFFLIFK